MRPNPRVSSFLFPSCEDLRIDAFFVSSEVHPFIYDALLSLVLVHAQVTATARPLVPRALENLVEQLAVVSLDAFSKVERFGMGGMLQVRPGMFRWTGIAKLILHPKNQATLEIEFMHQTLSQHVTPLADSTLQSIYKTISQSYYRKPSPNSAGELQQELEGLKRTLVASRRATALQVCLFLQCIPIHSNDASTPCSSCVSDALGWKEKREETQRLKKAANPRGTD